MLLDGGLIAVSETLQLPAQPAVGATFFVPLGGDGFTAPKFGYAIRNFSLTGDATGTFVEHTISFDERYCSLVSYVTLGIQQATSADADFQFTINSDRSAQLNDSGTQTAVVSGVSGVEIGRTWNPPAYIYPGAGDNGRIRSHVLNVDTDVVTLSAFVYCFDVRVRETTPMGPLLWARGST